MISILIPTYNYNVFPLVKEAHLQGEKASIPFEILVYDDCSPNPVGENENINQLTNGSFLKLPKNIGRSAIRNKLARDAKYPNLLFLDADTQIISSQFLKNYLHAIKEDSQIIYGGILYQHNKPNTAEILRWVYGNKREALPVTERNKQPHLRFLTLNFLIKKNVFSIIEFNEQIPNLRHEDTLFALDAKKSGINVSHIDNPVVHLGLESSEVFLRKSEESVDVLHLFLEKNMIDAEEVALTKRAKQLKKMGLSGLFLWFYKFSKNSMKENLLSKKPSLFIFDLYRLGHYLNYKSSNA
ncbi:MAG TPA: glycosyl transferase [Flavobacteriaceae bacterium]|nr:glycosyl transferase [Flavobacteriaceae bacterium]HAT64660.1 glycosyl transferase [Flavobacteriaceae bacterium]|tara:strand:+ start:58766 stop:59659 length:894 start_codon:yes stop_codon:yes gene_type:complete